MLNKENIKDIYRLSPMQEGLFFHSLREIQAQTYFMQISFDIVGQLDAAILKETWEYLFERHDILRTVFIYKKVDVPLQVVLKKVHPPCRWADVSSLSPEEQTAEIEKIKGEDRRKGFELSKEVLMRMTVVKCGTGKNVVIWSYHHIIMDGWSMGLVLSEFLEIYLKLKKRLAMQCIPETPYSSYIQWLEKQEKREAFSFWRDYLEGFGGMTPVPQVNDKTGQRDSEHRRISFTVEKHLSQKLRDFAQEYQYTLSVILQVIWGIILQRLNSTDDVVFGTVVSGRPVEVRGIEDIPGLFINVIPLRVRCGGSVFLKDILDNAKKASVDSLPYQYVPLAELQVQLKRKEPLFNHIVLFNNYPLESRLDKNAEGQKDYGFKVGNVASFEQTHYPLTIIIMPFDEIAVEVAYDSHLYDARLMNNIEGYYKSVIEQVLKDINRPAESVRIFSDKEWDCLLQRYRGVKDSLSGSPDIWDSLRSSLCHEPCGILCVQDNEEVCRDGVARLAERLEKLIRSQVLREDVSTLGCCSKKFKLIAACLLLAGRLNAGLFYIPPSENGLVPEEFLDCMPQVLMTDDETLLADNIKCTADQNVKLYIQHGGTDSDIRYPFTVYNRNRLGRPFCSGVTEKAFSAMLHVIIKRFSLTPSSGIVVVSDTLDDFQLAFILCAVYLKANITIIGPENADFAAGIDSKPAYLLFASSDRNLFIRILTQVSKDGRSPALVLPYAYVNPELFDKLGDIVLADVYSVYGSFGEGFLLGENIYKGNLFRMGTPLENIFCTVLDKDKGIAPFGIKGNLYIRNEGAELYQLSGKKKKGCRSAANPVDGKAFLYNTGLKGFENGEGEFELSGENVCFYRGKAIIDEDLEILLTQRFRLKECKVYTRFSFVGKPILIIFYVSQYPLCEPSIYCFIKETAGDLFEALQIQQIPNFLINRNGDYDFSEIDDLMELIMTIHNFQQLKRRDEVEKTDFTIQISGIRTENGLQREIPPESIPEIAPLMGQEWQAVSLRAAGSDKMGLLDGGEPGAIPETKNTLVKALGQAVQGNKEIIYYDMKGSIRKVPYKELFKNAGCILSGLQEIGFRPGDKVVLAAGGNFIENICTFWACILGGIIPLNIMSKKLGAAKLTGIADLLENPYIIAGQEICEQIQELEGETGRTFKVLKLEQVLGRKEPGRIYSPPPDSTALLQLSSGSTGRVKCIPLTHRNILSHIYAESSYNSFDSEEKTLNWIPFDHVVPVMSHLRDVVLCYTQVQADNAYMLSDITYWLDMIDRHRITRTWAPNFAFRLLNKKLEASKKKEWNLSTLKSLMNAGEQVTRNTLTGLRAFLKETQLDPMSIQPAYGLAETSTCVVYKPLNRDMCVQHVEYPEVFRPYGGQGKSSGVSFVECGSAIPGAAIGIYGKEEEILPQNTVGQVCIKGDMVMKGYYNQPGTDSGTFTKDGWLCTGDLGFIQEDRLYITGRVKETIIINGVHYSCYEIEDFINTCKGVCPGYAAVVGIKDISRETESVAVLFSPEKGGPGENSKLVYTLKRDIARYFGIVPKYIIPIDKEEFLKTSSGKIQRAELVKRLCGGQWNSVIKEMGLISGKPSDRSSSFFSFLWVHKKLNKSYFKAKERNCLIVCEQGTKGLFGISGGWGGNVTLVERVRGKSSAASMPVLPEELPCKESPADVLVYTFGFDPVNPDPLDTKEVTEAIRNTIFPVFDFIKNLGAGGKTPSELYFVSKDTQRVDRSKPVSVVNGFIPGILRSLGEEWQECAVKHIDFAEPDKGYDYAGLIMEEIASNLNDREVVYGDGVRLVPRLEELGLTEVLNEKAIPLQEGGFYLVTGGLSDVGKICIRYLMKNFNAKILVIGRTSLDSDGSPAALRKKEIFEELKTLNGCLEYASIDVKQYGALYEKVQELKSRWSCPLNGVWHLANIYGEGLYTRELDTDMAIRMVEAKIIGAVNLHKLLSIERNPLFVSFSSVNSYMGGINAGLYSSVNSALNQWMHSLTLHTDYRVKNLCWSRWGVNTPGREQWFTCLAEEDAADVLDLALKSDETELIIGLNGDHPKIQSMRTDKDLKNKELTVISESNYLEKEIKPILEPLQRRIIERKWSVSMIKSSENPAEPQESQHSSRHKKEIIKFRPFKEQKPRTDLERQVWQIWREVLETDDIGIYEDFYALGGHSIKAIQIHARLIKIKENIPFNSLEKYPTIAEFTENVLQGGRASEPELLLQPMNKRYEGRPNLFLLHPAIGEVVSYQKAGHYMEEKVNLYGIQAKGLYNPGVLLDSDVRQIAQSYLEEILSAQKGGTYYIGAYSLSVHLGFELVKIMEEKGLHVGSYLIVDNGPTEKAYDTRQIEEKLDTILRGVFERVINLSVHDRTDCKNEALVDEVYRKYADRNNMIHHIQKGYFIRFLQVVRNLYRCVMDYEIKGQVNADFVYLVTDKNKCRAGCDGWESYTRNRCVLDFLEGTHTSILVEPDCKLLAYKLTEYILKKEGEWNL